MKQSGNESLPDDKDKERATTQLAAQVTQIGIGAAKLDPTSKKTQVIDTPPDSQIAGTSAEFPPGAVAVPTQISIQTGGTIAQLSTLNDLKLNTEIAGAASAVTITSSVAMDTVTPFTLAIPIPANSGLLLSDPLINLVVLYRVNKVGDGGTAFSGVIPMSLLQIAGTTVRFKTQYFGTYQAVITKTLVTKVAEAPASPLSSGKAFVHFVRGAAASNFATNSSVSGGLSGWVQILSSARVSAPLSNLTTDIVTKTKREDQP